MATNTEKLNLVLPDGSDTVKVGELNGNFRKLDEAYGQLSEEIAGKADIPTKQSTGAQIIVTDAAPQPAVRLVSHIEATQAGEGDPSFDNVRSISGFNTITVANSDSGQTLTADLPETAYDGSLDWGTGAVEDHGTLLTLTGEEGMIPGPSGEYYYGTIAFGSSVLKCSHLIAGSQNQGGVAVVSGQLRFYTAAKFPSLAKWKAALAEQYAAGTPVQVLVHSTNALTMQVEPQIMEMRQGTNTLHSNSGNTELEYVVDSQITLSATVENAIAPVREQAERNHARLEEVEGDIDKLFEDVESLKVDSLNKTTWAGIQNIVRAGLASKIFPVGTQFQVNHSVFGIRVFDVVAHDYFKSVDNENAHTMTIQQHDLLPGTQFDAPEAFYYAEDELAAGTYNVILATAYSSWAAGTYQFTLTQAVPAGGQLRINGYENTAITSLKVQSFANRTTNTAIESVSITAGSGGTNLGTFGEGAINHIQRVSYGSNNYKESAARQFLNSSAAAGSVWTPQTKFDRPPSWQTSLAGYKAGLDQDFLAVVGKVVLSCAANNLYEAPDSSIAKGETYTLNDEFYLASRAEIFGSYDVNDGTVLFPYYEGAGNADRIKYRDGSAAHWWLRTPNSGVAYTVRRVYSDGTMSNVTANSAYGLAPACTIV